MNFCRLMFFSLLLCLVFPLTLYADQLEDASEAIKNEDYKKAYKLLLPLAEDKNPEAQIRLGALYVNGQGVEKDFNKGLALIMEAATKGYVPARAMALKLCIDLANQGDTAAMYNVGYMCLNGWGGEPDTDVCLKWLETAGKMGHEKSAGILSRIYTKGMFGVTPDEEEAAYWNNLLEDFAAGIDGKWKGSLSMGPGGQPMDMSYEFETDGDKLTGTQAGFGGTKIAIEDGIIDGNNFSFKVTSNFGGMKSTSNYTGEFFGDTIKLTYTMETSRPRGTRSTKRIRRNAGGESPPISFDLKRAE